MMRFYIIPLGPVCRLLHKAATSVFGKEELEDLRTDLVPPVMEFIDEVYEDTVGDVKKEKHPEAKV